MNFRKHIFHYTILFVILALGLFFFTLFSYDKAFQAFVALGIAASYVVWGIVHHHIHRDLHFPVVIEYLVVAALGLILVFSLILRV